MDAIELFNKTSLACSKLITQNYSTSFNLGINLLGKKYHTAIYAIYGFVRLADEIVDTFLDCDRRKFLESFKKDTFEAIENGLSFNPVLHAFQIVVNQYKIEKHLIEAFLKSMAMDLSVKEYGVTMYQEYVYGSAEVVGLMCLRVFCEGDDTLYHQLEWPARKLGSAFQKVNFLRDLKSDYEERGRIYFPGVDYKNFNEACKMAIIKEIQEDFDQAEPGIKGLPENAQTGVRMACIYFKRLLQKIANLPPEAIIQKRIRISNSHKLFILITEKCLYLLLNIMILLVPFCCSFESRINYSGKWNALFPAIFLTAAFFILWDILFTRCGVWRFNPRYLIGVNLFNLPIEEWMFFFTVPYSCVFIYESMNYLVPVDICQPLVKPFLYTMIPVFLSTSLLWRDKTYTCVNGLVAIVTILAHLFVFGEQFFGRFIFSLIIHYLPFFICNGILCGGAGTEEPVVIYNENKIINFRIKNIPIEDLVYSMSLLLMNVSLFEWFRV